jgi:uncharacterized membrane protein
MRLFRRFTQGNLHLTRIEAFSDGVFAIVVTLLVLDLKVPDLHRHNSAAELWHALSEQMPRFLSWLISFVIVCKFWLNHHYVMGLARYANYGMVWLNSLFLMFQSFIPFPTAMMGEYPRNPLAVSCFGIVMALNTLLFMALQGYILRNLAKPDLVKNQDPKILVKSLVGPLFYLLGAGTAWLNPRLAVVFYMITPLFFITPPSREEPVSD